MDTKAAHPYTIGTRQACVNWQQIRAEYQSMACAGEAIGGGCSAVYPMMSYPFNRRSYIRASIGTFEST